ncbi:MAG: nucleotidyltransferase family protein [Chloroflexi bacterium]|nr:nucleotidyltransferase family protein [Chloroflexota bacterium]
MPVQGYPERHLDPETRAFYRRALWRLHQEEVPFLVGGAYAFERYTGIARHTKDLDVFVREADHPRALAALEQDGCRGDVPFPHWLAKAYCGEHVVDIIFGSGNGVAPVDDLWFAHAVDETVLDVPVKIVPAEEMIWQKALIMERERFDGADVAHLLRARAETMDWRRLLARFGRHWPVLLSHLILFGYIYPEEQARLPAGLLRLLLRRAETGMTSEDALTPPDADGPLCNGPVLSRTQYVVDVEQWGYQDGRVEPVGLMTVDDAATWTEAGLAG